MLDTSTINSLTAAGYMTGMFTSAIGAIYADMMIGSYAGEFGEFRDKKSAYAFLFRSLGTGLVKKVLSGRGIRDEDIDLALTLRPKLRKNVNDYLTTYYQGSFQTANI